VFGFANQLPEFLGESRAGYRNYIRWVGALVLAARHVSIKISSVLYGSMTKIVYQSEATCREEAKKANHFGH